MVKNFIVIKVNSINNQKHYRSDHRSKTRKNKIKIRAVSTKKIYHHGLHCRR